MSPLSKEKQKKNWVVLAMIVIWIVLIFGVTLVKLTIHEPQSQMPASHAE